MTDSLHAGSWPFVGRETELDQIRRLREEDELPGVVLHGAAGVGKSRLARQLLGTAERSGVFVEWVQATQSAAVVPLGAVARLLSGLRSSDPLELLRDAGASLRERAAGRAVMLGVDDAHLLDATSASLVLHLVTTHAAFVVATVRADEPCPDAIVSLWKDVGALRLELEQLDEGELGVLVEAALHGPLEQAARRWLYDRSQGNVLYARELVLGALAEGALLEVNGLWRLSARPPPSRPLVELVSARMTDLDRDERRTLELLALGEPLQLEEVVGLTGSEPLAAVEGKQLAAVSARIPGEVRVAHPLYGEVLRAQMPVARARELRLRLASAVRAREPRTADDALRIARWLLDAGEPVGAETLLEGARAANVSGDPALAARLAGAALEAGAGAEAALVLARALALQTRFEEAEDVLRAAEDSLEAPEVAAAYLEQRTSVLQWGLNRPAEAMALLERAAPWWPDEAWRRRLDPLRLRLVATSGDVAAAVELGDRLLAESGLDPSVRRQLEPVHASNLLTFGQAGAAYDLALRIRPQVPLRDETDDLALIVCGMIGVQGGHDWAELDGWLTGLVAEGVRADDHGAVGIAALMIAALRLIAGRYHAAARWLAEAEVHLEHRDAYGALLLVHSTRVGIAYYTGDAVAAEAAIRRFRETLAGATPLRTQRPYIARAEAWAAGANADHLRGQQILLDAAADYDDVPVSAAELLYTAMLAGARGGAPEARLSRIAHRLAVLRRRCDAPLVQLYSEHASAFAARDGTALLQTAEGFGASGQQRYACEAAAHAATVFAGAGREDSARRAAVRSADFHVPSEGGFAPVIPVLARGGVGLTSRERQVVELAGRGLSNGEIAERLVLSVRTVESHVYRAMQKLGVGDRRDLTGRVPE